MAELPAKRKPRAPALTTKRIKKYNHRHDFIIHLAACAISVEEMSRRTGLPCSYIEKFLGSPLVQSKVTEMRRHIFKSVEVRLKTILPKAIDTAEAIMEDKKEKGSTRLLAAQDFMDRTLGKSTQRVEHTGSSLREIFEQLDALKKKVDAKDVTVEPGQTVDKNGIYADAEIIEQPKTEAPAPQEQPAKDPIDAWVEKNI